MFGFPLQAIFDLRGIRARGGKIAKVSALAVHPDFRKTGGATLFPLMKFMYEYCTAFFDTRHVVIAVHPTRIEMYESLLMFTRLAEKEMVASDFANGAPAVGGAPDLQSAPQKLRKVYGRKTPRKNLYRYFIKSGLPNIVLPQRRYYTTNDPVMTTELLNYFFNQRTQVFADLGERKKMLLHAIYALPEPQANTPVPTKRWGEANIQLGHNEQSAVHAMAVKGSSANVFHGFTLAEPDVAWRKFVGALTSGVTQDDLAHATRFS